MSKCERDMGDMVCWLCLAHQALRRLWAWLKGRQDANITSKT